MGLGFRKKIRLTLSFCKAAFFKFNSVRFLLNSSFPDVSEWICLHTPHESEEKSISFQNIILKANHICLRHYLLLGTHIELQVGPRVWHQDPSSNTQWPLRYYKILTAGSLAGVKGSDVKIPWELSRLQHMAPLATAYVISPNNKYAEEAVHQITNWLEANPCPYGVNWTCAMEVAIRACNWMWAWWAFRDNPAWAGEFNQKFLKSMWQHGWYIEHNLENNGGIRTNHYLADVVGLLFIGVMFPQFRDSKRWKMFGVQELIRCMDEMVYPDGVSFENSTSYQRLALEMFAYSAMLCRRNNIELPESFWNRLQKMFEFVASCIRPDSRMPMIGDSDDGRFFILNNYYDWDRWDFRYLLAIGEELFDRQDFRRATGKVHEEMYWSYGKI